MTIDQLFNRARSNEDLSNTHDTPPFIEILRQAPHDPDKYNFNLGSTLSEQLTINKVECEKEAMTTQRAWPT